MKDDELILLGGLDQPIPTDNDWALKRIDAIIQESIEKKNAYIALNACKELVGVMKIGGLSLAKGLYLIQENWDIYGLNDAFADVAYAYIGLHEYTVSRYCNVWKMFAKEIVPAEMMEELQQRNIKELIPVATAISQGYELGKSDWQEISEAPDFSTVSRLMRDIKGQPPRKGSLQLMIDRSGSLWAFQNNDRFFVGSLELNSDEEVIQKAVQRIISNAGVMKQ
jgi:hypothetical protein